MSGSNTPGGPSGGSRGGMSGDANVDPERDASLIAALVADLAPVRPVPSLRMTLAVVFGSWLVASLAFVVGMPEITDAIARLFAGWSRGSASIALLVAGVAGVLAAVSASMPGSEPVERGAHRIGSSALAAALLISGVTAAAEAGVALRPATADAACFGLVLCIGLLPGVPLLFALRRGYVLRPLRASGIALLGAFGLGALTVQFVCPLTGTAHVFFGHMIPPAAAVLAAALPVALLLRGDRDPIDARAMDDTAA